MLAVTPKYTSPLLDQGNKPKTACCCMKVVCAVANFFKEIILSIYNLIGSFFISKPIAGKAIVAAPLSLKTTSLKTIALQRLVEIRDRTLPTARNPISFSPTEVITHFDLDQHLEPFSKNSEVAQIIELFDYAGMDTQDASVTSICQWHKRNKLVEIFAKYPRDKRIECPKERAARESLSQLYNIWVQKKGKVYAGTYDAEEFKTEIRTQTQEIIHAHEQCIDLANSGLENILLDAVMSELNTKNNRSKSQILAAHALFKLRSNLIKEICVQQNPNEELVPELERIVKQRLAIELRLHSRVTTTGAYYDYKIMNVEQKVRNARNEFFRRYVSAPVPYLQTEMQTYYGSKPLRKLRNEIMQQVMTQLDIASAYDDEFEVKDPEAKAIISIASKEGEDGFLMGQGWSTAGVLWIMERAGLIQENRI